jgi:serine phosphatase RsbU (regulator of sigma subunit)
MGAELTADGEGPSTIGRSSSCELPLQHDAVSRRHATVVRRRGQWFVIDEGSSGGTFVNGHRIEKADPTPLTGNDQLRIGPWVFRVTVGAASGATQAPTATIDDTATSPQQVRRAGERAGHSERRLRLLSEAIIRLNSALDESAAANAALESALAGSGYARGAVLRRSDSGVAGEVEVLASLRSDAKDDQAFTFSRTLIEQANHGETVVLTSGLAAANYGQSIIAMEIHSALCVPLGLGGSVTGYFYLDARGRESAVKADAAAFCESLAIAYGLAVASIQRARLARRQAEMHAQLSAAREVQQLVMPPEHASIGCVSYASRSHPGSFVAGDLLDVLQLPGGGAAVCLGDVSGHGAGAGMLMASAQAFLGAELRRLTPGQDPALAVSVLNRYLCERPLAGRFLSLWVGLLMPDGTLTIVDAGHGHWAHLTSTGEAGAIRYLELGGLPIGVEASCEYTKAQVKLAPGDRILVYSDGIVEQRDRAGQSFGASRLRSALEGSVSPREDIERVFGALAQHAPGMVLDDDATAISLVLKSP